MDEMEGIDSFGDPAAGPEQTPNSGARRSQPDTPPLLKTCQTCHRAKIRCDRTQDSGSCDRCLRLNKTCVFAPARRGLALAAQRPRAGLVSSGSGGRRARSRGTGASDSSRSLSPAATQRGVADTTQHQQTEASSTDPFVGGLLTVEHGERLLSFFKNKMVPHFPFVAMAEDVLIEDLRLTRPALCLAVLAAAAFEDPRLQRRLGSRFNQLVGLRMTKGQFASLDMLQGLLVSLAWAHYQPRPRRYSQHLQLAISIVSDMRLDKPKNSMLWSVGDKHTNRNSETWGPDELRALLGTYYLASSSSTLLQKSGYFHCTDYILQCGQMLGEQAGPRTDKFLSYLIRLQQLSEEVDDMATGTSKGTAYNRHFGDGLMDVRSRLELLKTGLAFPLSDCPTAFLHANTLEALLIQSPMQGPNFNLEQFQHPGAEDTGGLLISLSESVSCVKSLISMILVLAPGEEYVMTNLGWIMLYRGLSLAVRLDMAMATGPVAPTTQHLRRLLDLRHTLRQIVLRLESATGPIEDDTGDRDTFYHLCRRARLLETWYLEHSTPSSTPQSTETHDSSLSAGTNMNPVAEMAPGMALHSLPDFLFSDMSGTSSLYFTSEGLDDLPSTGHHGMGASDVFGLYSHPPGSFTG